MFLMTVNIWTVINIGKATSLKQDAGKVTRVELCSGYVNVYCIGCNSINVYRILTFIHIPFPFALFIIFYIVIMTISASLKPNY